MKTQVIIQLSKELNAAIIEYQEAYKGLHGKRGPSKASIPEGLSDALISAVDEKTAEIERIKKQLEKSKV